MAEAKCDKILKDRKAYAIYKRKTEIWRIRSKGPNLSEPDEMYLLSVFHLFGSHSNPLITDFVPKFARLRKYVKAHGRKKSSNNYYVEYSRDGVNYYHYCTNENHNGEFRSD